jgi:hypothetical protein
VQTWRPPARDADSASSTPADPASQRSPLGARSGARRQPLEQRMEQRFAAARSLQHAPDRAADWR